MIQPPERRPDLADPQQLVRRLPKPMADPEFRSSLRAAFVSSAIPERRLPLLLRFLGAPKSHDANTPGCPLVGTNSASWHPSFL